MLTDSHLGAFGGLVLLVPSVRRVKGVSLCEMLSDMADGVSGLTSGGSHGPQPPAVPCPFG